MVIDISEVNLQERYSRVKKPNNIQESSYKIISRRSETLAKEWMFQQQHPPPTSSHSQQQSLLQQHQRKEQQQFVSVETQAREKLSHYVYEYLVHLGAAKTADMFKNEILAHSTNGNPNLQIDLSAGHPGFLYKWFSVFWDLYSTHPDKKDKAEPSNDAKAYHKMIFPACGFPEGMPNGSIYGQPGFHHGVNLPGSSQQNPPDGMFQVQAGYYNVPRTGPQQVPSQSNQSSPIPGGPGKYGQQGTRSGAPTPSNVAGPGNANANLITLQQPHQIAINEQMRLMVAQQQQQQRQMIQQQQNRIHMNQAAGPQGRIPVRPQFGSQNQYMESPSGTPPFPILNNHNGNGGAINAPLMSPSTTTAVQTSMGNSNPVIGGNESGPASQETARFIMMSTGTGTRSVPQQFMNNHEGPGSTGTSAAGPSSVSSGMNTIAVTNNNSELAGDLNNPSNTGPSSQLHSLLNGTNEISMEMKQSPVFSVAQQSAGVNGATPISATTVGNTGTGPGSVHSQTSGNNQQQGQQIEAMDICGNLGNHQSDEISKIKASLMEGFQKN